MNRQGHLISSLALLAIAEALLLVFLLLDYGVLSTLHAAFWSIGFFILGAIAPDFDHRKVQQKIKVIRWFTVYTKHRGHWHSIGAMLIYGGLIFLTTLWFVKYWGIVVGCGMFGYFSHLLEDQYHKWIHRSQAKNTLKLW